MAWAAWAAVCILWGTTYLAIRVGVRTWEPFLFGGLRFASAGVIVILVMLARGVRIPRDRAVIRDQVVIGVLLLAGGNAMVLLAERTVPSGITAVLASTMPIWTVVITSLLPGGQRVSRLNWVGLIAGLGGVVLLASPSFASPIPASRAFLWGVIGLQAGAISWAAGSVYASRRRAAIHPLLGAGMQMLAGGILLIVAGTVTGEWGRLAPDQEGWWSFLYLLVFGSLIGYVAFVYAIEHLPVNRVALYGYVNPVVAVFAGAVILGERFGAQEIAATVIVLGAVALAKGKSPASTAQASA